MNTREDIYEIPQIMKGFAIVFVVIHHVIVAIVGLERKTENLVAFLNGFHVAIFFALSGFFTAKSLLSKGNKLDCLSRRLKRLIFPYLSWQILFWLLITLISIIPQFKTIIESSGIEKKDILQMVVALLFFENSYTDTFWFLYVSVIYTIIAYCLNLKYCTKPLTSFVVFGSYLLLNGYDNLPMIIAKFFTHLPEFWLGIISYSLKPNLFNRLELNKVNIKKAVPVFALFLALGYLRYFAGGEQNNRLIIIDNIIRLLFSSLGIIVILELSALIPKAWGETVRKLG